MAVLKKNIGSLFWVLLVCSACYGENWNNPYSISDTGKNILYSVFTERPKHLDPVQSYSSNEIQFTAQIYEPPLQYHYLKRPFELIPLTASILPTVTFFDGEDNPLSNDVDTEEVAYSLYEIKIGAGIFYQPHAAFVRNDKGE